MGNGLELTICTGSINSAGGKVYFTKLKVIFRVWVLRINNMLDTVYFIGLTLLSIGVGIQNLSFSPALITSGVGVFVYVWVKIVQKMTQ
jgi:hypothetical protein